MARDTIMKGKLSKKERDRLKNIVDWVCLNVFLFFAVLLNYLYVTFLHDLTVSLTTYSI